MSNRKSRTTKRKRGSTDSPRTCRRISLDRLRREVTSFAHLFYAFSTVCVGRVVARWPRHSHCVLRTPRGDGRAGPKTLHSTRWGPNTALQSWCDHGPHQGLGSIITCVSGDRLVTRESRKSALGPVQQYPATIISQESVIVIHSGPVPV